VIRFLDILFSALGLVVGFPVLVILTLIGFFDTGSPIFRQERVGRNKKPFTLVKFRTMSKDTASVASHLASSASMKCSPKIGQLVKLAKTLKPSSQHEAEAQKIQPRV